MKNVKYRLFTPNVDRNGRIVRASGSLALAIVAALAWRRSVVTASGFTVASLFLASEAARGWCALRACGLKTKL
jgi:hypothetical protein